MQFWQLVATVLRLAREHRKGMASMVGLGICASLTESIGITLFLPLLQVLTGQGGAAYQNIPLLRLLHFHWTPGSNAKVAIPLLIAGAVVLRSLLTYGSNITNSWVKARVGHELRRRLMERVLLMDAASLEREGTSGLLNVLATESWRCSEATGIVSSLASGLGVVLVFGVFLCLTSLKLTLAALLSVGIISFGLRWVTRFTARWSEALVQASTGGYEVMVDNLSGLREIQAFSLQKLRDKLFVERSRRVEQVLFRLEAVAGLNGPISESVYAALLAAIFVLTLHDTSQLPTVLLFLMILFRLQPSVRGLEAQRANLFVVAGSVQEVDRFLREAPAPVWTGTLRPQFEEEIRLEDVSFRYGADDSHALRNVSMRIPKGKITAIVGTSGAGKTTLIQLLLGFRQCTAGRVMVDGAPLEQLDLDAWRGLTGTAFQDAYLFAVTVAENIRYGRPGATGEEIREAARLAHADEFIRELPDGYDTKLTEGGTTLSGGQRQRLALARALLRQPKLLILDEATNALDSVIESTIQEHIATVQDMTLIVIAHRFSALRNADQVIVMDGGEVVEQGHPDELMQRDGLFAQMSLLQGRGQPA